MLNIKKFCIYLAEIEKYSYLCLRFGNSSRPN